MPAKKTRIKKNTKEISESIMRKTIEKPIRSVKDKTVNLKII
ncbi:MAG: hypothetical protein ABIA04_15215 [Pseudomonadota bacterium]